MNSSGPLLEGICDSPWASWQFQLILLSTWSLWHLWEGRKMKILPPGFGRRCLQCCSGHCREEISGHRFYHSHVLVDGLKVEH